MARLHSSMITAKMGTPKIMPGILKRPPMTVMATSTAKELMPVLLPWIRGTRMLPSSCWMMRTRAMKRISFSGLVMRMMIPEGTAPMMGPKTGMTLVMAQMVAMRRLYSDTRKTDRAMNMVTPTARASTSTPLK